VVKTQREYLPAGSRECREAEEPVTGLTRRIYVRGSPPRPLVRSSS
jgi:hypothetical protein